MKCIIAGSRTITDYFEVARAIEASGWSKQITEVVCGKAIGVDTLGEWWAENKGISVVPFPVTKEDYRIYGRYKAPKIRNERMASYADALILVWDGISGGSKDMLERAIAHGLKYYVYKIAG